MEFNLCGAPVRIGIYFIESKPEVGGVYTYMADLLVAFAKMVAVSEHQYIIMCDPAAARSVKFMMDAPNVAVVPISRPSCLVRWLSPLFPIVLRSTSIEHIARHNSIQLLWFFGSVECVCHDIPYVTTIFDLQHRLQPFFPEVSTAGTWDAREQFFGYSLRRAAYCVTGTETGRREIEYLYQVEGSRICVLPLPTPKFALDATPSEIDVRSHFGIKKKYIYYPAQFWPHKNHANLILALKWLKNQRKLEIVLVLSGSDKGNLSFIQRFAKQQGMTDQVRFLGFVSEKELIALYQQAVALTFVTYFGPDNLPPLEAFALGCPVVASSVPGAKEQYGDAVLHVNPSVPEDIGQAIYDVYSDETLRLKLVKAGFERARKWTSGDYINEMFKLFDEFSAIRRNWL